LHNSTKWMELPLRGARPFGFRARIQLTKFSERKHISVYATLVGHHDKQSQLLYDLHSKGDPLILAAFGTPTTQMFKSPYQRPARKASNWFMRFLNFWGI
ncbi:hypothetical protein, partial [Paenibacillus sp. MMS18-CY102]|uniref:hypothetical protein n=1 Tax=Paenibacillus sp. MMS18-CY102 TaxID=2682849 RepID=UPI001F225FDC